MNKFPKIPFRIVDLERFQPCTSSPYGGSQGLILAFCYPEEGPILVRGMFVKVNNYIGTKVGPCHYNFARVNEGCISSNWFTNVHHTYLGKKKRADGRKVFELSDYRGKEKKKVFLRKIPLRFLKEFKGVDDNPSWREASRA